MTTTIKKLEISASLGTLQLLFKRDDQAVYTDLGFTHDDSPANLTFETENADHMVTRFGNQIVQRLGLGTNVSLEAGIVFDVDALSKLTNEIVPTAEGTFLDSATAGYEAIEGILRLHPIKNGGDNSEDIYILAALLTVGSEIESGSNGKARTNISVAGKPREGDMIEIDDDDVTVTAVVGGALTDATTYGYMISGSDNVGYAIPSTSKTGLTATPNLSLTVEFPRVLGAQIYRIWRTLDAGTTWAYTDKLPSALTLSTDGTEYTYTDAGADTFTTATPNVANTAKFYTSVKFGGNPADIVIA